MIGVKYQIPRMEDILLEVGKAQWKSQIDLALCEDGICHGKGNQGRTTTSNVLNE